MTHSPESTPKERSLDLKDLQALGFKFDTDPLAVANAGAAKSYYFIRPTQGKEPNLRLNIAVAMLMESRPISISFTDAKLGGIATAINAPQIKQELVKPEEVLSTIQHLLKEIIDECNPQNAERTVGSHQDTQSATAKIGAETKANLWNTDAGSAPTADELLSCLSELGLHLWKGTMPSPDAGTTVFLQDSAVQVSICRCNDSTFTIGIAKKEYKDGGTVVFHKSVPWNEIAYTIMTEAAPYRKQELNQTYTEENSE